MRKFSKKIITWVSIAIVTMLIPVIVFAARTQDLWIFNGGTYMNPNQPGGLDILINGTNHYLNFGTFSGSSGYGFRDNGGTIEFKNNGGSWTAIGSGGGGSGTVTSVDMTVPTGLSISGNPITTTGTLALTLTAGYNIPLTASTTQWNNLVIASSTFARFGYLFPQAGNGTSTLTQFNGGLTAYSTSTIGSGTQAGGLTTNGGATTTLNQYIGGTLGVGINNPGSTAEIATASNASLTVDGNSSSVASSIGLADKLTVTNVFSSLLNPSGTSGANLATLPLSATFQTGSGSTGGIIFISKAATGPIIFGTGGSTLASERMRITSAGNVGIGTTTPTSMLQVTPADGTGVGFFMNGQSKDGSTDYSGGVDIVLTHNGAGNRQFAIGNSETKTGIRIIGGAGFTDLDGYDWNLNNNQPLNIDPNGSGVGIRDASPGVELSVVGNSAIGYASGQTAPANSLIVNSKLGVGTTTPGTFLSIQGAANFDAGSSTIYSGLVVPVIAATSTTASSTFANGINLTKGCFSVLGVCVGSGSGAISSVSNADGTLTISPTTGAVVASLALTHANSWTALQQFINNASSTSFSSNTAFFGATGTTTITSAGNVGIGTKTPGSALVISGADKYAQIINTDTAGSGLLNFDQVDNGFTNSFFIKKFGSTATTPGVVQLWNVDNAAITFATNNLPQMTILGNGNVGIGNANPLALLSVNGTASTTNLTISGISSCSGSNALTTNVTGVVACGAISGSGGAAYPFQLAGNATSTLTQFNGGLTAYASSTISFLTTLLSTSTSATTTNLAVTGQSQVGTVISGTWNGSTIAIANGGTGATTAGNAFAGLSPQSTKGDLIGYNGATIPGRLAVGTNETFLQASSTQALGLAYSTVSLARSVQDNLPVTNLNTGINASASTFWRGDGTWATPSGSGTVNSGLTGQNAYYAANGTAVSGSSTIFTATNSFVGISSTTPWARLSVGDSSGSGQPLFAIGTSSPGVTGTTTAFIVDPNGRVGIGTTTPTTNAKLAITGGNIAISSGALPSLGLWASTGTGGRNYRILSGESSIPNLAGSLAFLDDSAAGAVRMVINSSGSVGIGTTTPWGLLSINGSAGGTIPVLAVSTSTAAFATSSAFTIDQNGDSTFFGKVSNRNGDVLSAQSSYIVSTSTANGNFTNVQSAINALPSTGGLVHIRCGIYTLPSGNVGIAPKVSNTIIEGEGNCTQFNFDKANTNNAVEPNVSNLTGLVFRDFYIHQTNATFGGIGINASNTPILKVENIKIDSTATSTQIKDTLNLSFYQQWNHLDLRGNTSCVDIGGNPVNDNVFTDIRCSPQSGNKGYALYLDSSSSNGAQNNTFINFDSEPTGAGTGITGIYANNAVSNYFINSYVEGNGVGYNFTTNSQTNIIHGGIFLSNTSYTASGSNNQYTLRQEGIAVNQIMASSTIQDVTGNDATVNDLSFRGNGNFAKTGNMIDLVFNNSTDSGAAIHIVNPGTGLSIKVDTGTTSTPHLAVTALRTATNGNAVCNVGTEIITGGAQTCALSSQFVKHDIQDITDSTAQEVLRLDPKQYVYNDHNDSGDARYGFIAEEVAKIDPKLVDLAATTTVVDGHTFEKGDPISVDYLRYVALLTKFVQDQQKQINSIKGVARSAEENWQWLVMGLLAAGFVYQQIQIRKLKK